MTKVIPANFQVIQVSLLVLTKQLDLLGTTCFDPKILKFYFWTGPELLVWSRRALWIGVIMDNLRNVKY